MNRFQMAKLVQWAGTLRSRKRLQKVVFLLQAKGCPFEAEYTLHHYGPYSQEVARLSDEMVQNDLLKELSQLNQTGRQYSYEMTEHARKRLSEFEVTAQGKQMTEQLALFEEQAKQLLTRDLGELEVAATMVYFRQQGHDWPGSVERTCKFKNLPDNKKWMDKVQELARQFIA